MLIFNLLSFFSTVYLQDFPTSNTNLSHLIKNYNDIVESPYAIKYPTMNDYTYFFGDSIFQTITWLDSLYRRFNPRDYSPEKIDTFYIRTNPCSQNDNDNNSGYNRTGFIENDIDTMNIKSNVISTPLSDNIIVTFEDVEQKADSSFFYSTEPKTILVTDIPDTANYAMILDLYQKYSFWKKNDDSLNVQNERTLIFNQLLSRNRYLIYKKKITNYDEMKDWKLQLANISETDSIKSDTFYLYNKAALLLEDDKNPDNYKYISLNDFLKHIDINSIKIYTDEK